MALLPLATNVEANAACNLTPVAQHSYNISLSKAVEATIQRHIVDHKAAAFVAVLHSGKVIHQGAYGAANREFETPWTQDARYRLASVSKMMTAAALVRLADQGRLNWAAPVSHYLPDVNGVAGAMQIRHLVSMTSGLWQDEVLTQMAGLYPTGSGSTGVTVSPDDLLALAQKQPALDFQPGSTSRYTDTNFRILAKVIAAITNKSMPDAMRELLFDPAQMANSALVPYYGIPQPCQIPGYSERDEGLAYLWSDDFLASTGDGGVLSTGEDMVRFAQYLRQPQGGVPLIERLVDRDNRVAPAASQYRLGTRAREIGNDIIVGHAGASGADLVHVTELDLQIVTLVNRSYDELDRDAVTSEIIAAFKGSYPRAKRMAFKSVAAYRESDTVLWPALRPGTYVDPEEGLVVRVEPKKDQAVEFQFLGYAVQIVNASPKAKFASGEGFTVTPDKARGAIDIASPYWPRTRRFARVENAASQAAPLGVYRADSIGALLQIVEEDGKPYLLFAGNITQSVRKPLEHVAPYVWEAGGFTLHVAKDGKGLTLHHGDVLRVAYTKLDSQN
jgi:CubicO group peptidase (beta-lactamase class C family)